MIFSRRWTPKHRKNFKRKIQQAYEMRHNPTLAERKAWVIIKQICRETVFRQYVLLGYILDFYIPKKQVCIEIDGGTHLGRESYDNARDANLRQCGVKTIRVDNEVVLNQPDKFAEIVARL